MLRDGFAIQREGVPSAVLAMPPTINLSATAWHQRESQLLAPYAMFSRQSAGRRYDEPLHAYRGPFQRDRDRILHSAALRRLSGKMQVFTGDMGDYHRTRLTHTHEVSTIARTLGRVLRLNEDLIEALALLHDIGHPPYGHCGEDALNDCLRDHDGFSHNRFASVLAEELEVRHTPFSGLNLTREVLEGQDFRVTHCGQSPLLEVQVVDLADGIAYNAHDVDDALQLGLLQLSDLQSLDLIRRASRWNQSSSIAVGINAARQALVHGLIDVQVADVIEQSHEVIRDIEQFDCLTVRQLGIRLELSLPLRCERAQLEQFLFDKVYRHPRLMEVRQRAAKRVQALFRYLTEQPAALPHRFQTRAQITGVEQAVGCYLAGMTDRFCDEQYRRLVELGETCSIDW